MRPLAGLAWLWIPALNLWITSGVLGIVGPVL